MIAVHRRVVITGVGIVSPLGNTKEQLWHGLSHGQSGVGPVTLVPPHALPVPFAAEAKSFQGRIEDFGPLEKEQMKAIRKGLKVMCRECQMGVAAAQLALSDAELGTGRSEPSRTGICFGSDYMITLPDEFTDGIAKCLKEGGVQEGKRFEFSRWPTEGMTQMSPLWLLKYLPNMPASHLAIYNDFRGPNNSLTVREAAANMVVAEAYQTILRGSADTMLVGATGTRVHPLKAVHALQQEELACDAATPSSASRPFDRDRTGMVLGEGAGALVLEERATALRRGAKIYGEVLGGTSSAVAGRNLLAHRDQAMINVLCSVLQSTGAVPNTVGHVHAHGLSTRSSDIEEAQALNGIFGHRDKPLPVVAAKSYFGNLGAGSGMVELIASLLAFEHNRLFPTLNFQTPDPDCRLNVVADDATAPGDSFINLSVTPQGQASAVLIRRPE